MNVAVRVDAENAPTPIIVFVKNRKREGLNQRNQTVQRIGSDPDHRPVPTSGREAEACPIALRAPAEAPASPSCPLDIAHSPSRKELSKEIVGRGRTHFEEPS